MERTIKMIIFLAIFLVIFLGLHYYVFARMYKLLDIKTDIFFYILIIILAVSFIGANMLERNYQNIFTKSFYIISATWIGILFFLFTILILFDIVNIFYKLPNLQSGIIILVLVLIITIYSIINASTLSVKEINIPIEGLQDDIKVVQLSDLHIGTIKTNAFLGKIIKKTNDINPDIVLITGDLVDGSAHLEENMFKQLNSINSEVFFVTGNHEFYEGLDKIKSLLANTKLNILEKDVEMFNDLQIIGVDFQENKDDIKDIINNMNITKDKPSILLYHMPTKIEYLKEKKINIQFSGHTHSGQIFPFNLLTRLGNPYISGLYEEDGSIIYVSPGTGTWGPPMRLGSKNEITVINLKSN